jgi:SAM-dependent methyltransferase
MVSPDEWLRRKLSRKPDAGDYADSTAPELDLERDPLALLKKEYPDLQAMVSEKRVADFGCGLGAQAIALAASCDCRVVGIDTNPRALADAASLARKHQMGDDQVAFRDFTAPDLFGTFDLVISQNAMEHFPEPHLALETMRRLLRPGGQIMLTFGPPWYAPWGAHMRFFCRVPWLNLLFREQTVLTVRASYRSDGARRYEDVESGLNRMSLRKLATLLAESKMRVEYIRCRGIKGQDWVGRLPLLRELLVNRVTCLLTRVD